MNTIGGSRKSTGLSPPCTGRTSTTSTIIEAATSTNAQNGRANASAHNVSAVDTPARVSTVEEGQPMATPSRVAAPQPHRARAHRNARSPARPVGSEAVVMPGAGEPTEVPRTSSADRVAQAHRDPGAGEHDAHH